MTSPPPPSTAVPEPATNSVVRVPEIDASSIVALLARYGLEGVRVAGAEPIPGSYWGECEAGLEGDQIFWRTDTPVHSVLHEASHFICMDPERRSRLYRDAGGDYEEENAVCYLQIVLADELGGFDGHRMCRDMDAWGYTFRLGSARAWFEADADDAKRWLQRHGILDQSLRPTWKRREQGPAGPEV